MASRNASNRQDQCTNGKFIFSGKHRLFGLKVEVHVLHNGLATFCSPHRPGSKSDISIMHDMAIDHENALQKKDVKAVDTDLGIGVDNIPGFWGILCDRGYQEANEYLRTASLHKKPIHGAL